jgi:hypothetical protein
MAGLGLDALPERTAVEDEIRKNIAEAEQLAAGVDAAGAGLKGTTSLSSSPSWDQSRSCGVSTWC